MVNANLIVFPNFMKTQVAPNLPHLFHLLYCILFNSNCPSNIKEDIEFRSHNNLVFKASTHYSPFYNSYDKCLSLVKFPFLLISEIPKMLCLSNTNTFFYNLLYLRLSGRNCYLRNKIDILVYIPYFVDILVLRLYSFCIL